MGTRAAVAACNIPHSTKDLLDVHEDHLVLVDFITAVSLGQVYNANGSNCMFSSKLMS
jgi:hypothetical protein